MIRILSYNEHRRGKMIFDRYLYLAAYILPFAPEEVIGSDMLEVDGKIITAANFYKETKKRPRRRTEKYQKLLKRQGIMENPVSLEQQFVQDRLLAAKLIRNASRKLYAFLYCTDDVEQNPKMVPPVILRNLRRLLTVKMDELDAELKAIGEIKKEYSEDLQAEVFRYEMFAKNPHAVKMLADMDVNVCPYCNRLYTVTITGKGGKSRPQFEHYKNKAEYPYFAVSIMNLIPSCGLCNQTKGDRKEEVLYPYSDEMGKDAVFRTKIDKGISYLTGNRDAEDEFSVTLDIVNPGLSEELKKKIENSDELFNLTRLYNKHKDYILYLFWKNYVFSEEYLELLCKEFPEVFRSVEDVKRMMYLMDISQEQWGKRPLGKLTHDIDAEINGEL